MRKFIIASTVLIAACELSPSQGARQTDAQPVYYGTEAPQHVPLTAGQILAIGTFGGCSGTLVAPTWVLTAAHCGLNPGTQFCIGSDPGNPDICYSALDTIDHVSGDMTIVELDQDATELAPGVVPIELLSETLDSSWIGTIAEAAGYGQTETGGYGHRLFTAEPIVELSGDELTVDGEGVHGVCYGDSGGPVMVIAGDGSVRVAGALSWGDPSCVGRDYFTRVDTYRDWLDEHVGPALELFHAEVLGPIQADKAVPLSATLAGANAAVSVFYSTDETNYTEVVMTSSGADWAAEIPAQADGTVVSYYMDGTIDGGHGTAPKRAPANHYGYFVGERTSVFFDDFESDLGWIHGADFGVDDWERGAPAGAGGDPGAAFSGTQAWGTDLGLAGGNGKYRSDSTTWLESPVISCAGCSGTRLQYRRWLQVEDGQYDRARVLVNGNIVWENRATGAGETHRRDAHWTFHDIDISEYADGSEDLVIRFELNSNQSLTFGGWTLDDVNVVAESVTTGDPGDDGRGCSCTMVPRTPRASGILLLLALAGAFAYRRRRWEILTRAREKTLTRPGPNA